MASASVLKFPRWAVFRSKARQRLLTSFFNESRKLYPDKSGYEHWRFAQLCESVEFHLSKSKRQLERKKSRE